MSNQSEIVGGALFTPLPPELKDISKLRSGASYSNNVYTVKTNVPSSAVAQPTLQPAPVQAVQQQPAATPTPQSTAPVQPQTIPANFCTACGAKITPGSRFCEECGHEI